MYILVDFVNDTINACYAWFVLNVLFQITNVLVDRRLS